MKAFNLDPSSDDINDIVQNLYSVQEELESVSYNLERKIAKEDKIAKKEMREIADKKTEETYN